MEISYLWRLGRERFCHLAGAYNFRYMQILSRSSMEAYHEFAGADSRIHKHLLKRNTGAAEVRMIRGVSQRAAHSEDVSLRCKSQVEMCVFVLNVSKGFSLSVPLFILGLF